MTLWFTLGFVVQGAGRDDDIFSIPGCPGQAGAALGAECRGESFGLGELVAFGQLLTADPGQVGCWYQEVGGIAAATGLPAATAVAELKKAVGSVNFVADFTAEAGSPGLIFRHRSLPVEVVVGAHLAPAGS